MLTFLVGYIVQEMTVRLGAVTHRGMPNSSSIAYGKFWGFFSMSDLVLGNFLTLVTEFIGVRAGLGFFRYSSQRRRGWCTSDCARRVTTGRYWTWSGSLWASRFFKRAFSSRRDSGASRLALRRPRVPHLDATAHRKQGGHYDF